ncbi:MAG: hypothetical protein AAFQ90_05515 [Pseudomonadota bacterium]
MRELNTEETLLVSGGFRTTPEGEPSTFPTRTFEGGSFPFPSPSGSNSGQTRANTLSGFYDLLELIFEETGEYPAPSEFEAIIEQLGG